MEGQPLRLRCASKAAGYSSDSQQNDEARRRNDESCAAPASAQLDAANRDQR